MRKVKPIVCLFLVLFVFLAYLPEYVYAQDKDKLIINDENRIYYGNPKKQIKNPAVIDSSRIFAEIPAYQKIIKEKLTEKNPKYWILMEEANKVFKKALKKAAKNLKVDLVAEIGAIERKSKEIPDITDKVIEEL